MSLLTLEGPTLSEQDFNRISEIIYEHCGINLHEGKKELVRARLAKQLRLGRFKTFEDYLLHVFNDPTGRSFSELVDSLSTNLTSFFREDQHFEYLREEFLPRLVAKKRSRTDFRIRAWSAGCSSGEEPYSLAITLLEAVQGQGSWDVKVLGTDLSTRMLELARAGCYEPQRVAPVPALLKQKYLSPVLVHGEKCYEAGSELKKTVILKYVNLMQDWPLRGPIDFIFCRNVMIYFDKPTQQRLVQRFYDLLDDGGGLFTGHSESLTGIVHRFKYVRPTIYMKA
jgi:chemotaxis protein methyltransferase CheR